MDTIDKKDKESIRRIKSLMETLQKAIDSHVIIHGEDSVSHILVMEVLAQLKLGGYRSCLSSLQDVNSMRGGVLGAAEIITFLAKQMINVSYQNILKQICDENDVPVMFKIVKIENE